MFLLPFTQRKKKFNTFIEWNNKKEQSVDSHKDMNESQKHGE